LFRDDPISSRSEATWFLHFVAVIAIVKLFVGSVGKWGKSLRRFQGRFVRPVFSTGLAPTDSFTFLFLSFFYDGVSRI